MNPIALIVVALADEPTKDVRRLAQIGNAAFDSFAIQRRDVVLRKRAPVSLSCADEQLATNVVLVEWLVKLQQQLSLQQRLIEQQQQQISAQQQEIEQLKEERDKLKTRSSQNSSVPPSSDLLKKPSDKSRRKKGNKRGPKYNHPGTTRNGFGTPDQIVTLSLENCPVCGTALEPVAEAPEKVQQVAEVIEQPREIREYRRPLYQCPNCGWSGYSPLPLGVKEGFS